MPFDSTSKINVSLTFKVADGEPGLLKEQQALIESELAELVERLSTHGGIRLSKKRVLPDVYVPNPKFELARASFDGMLDPD